MTFSRIPDGSTSLIYHLNRQFPVSTDFAGLLATKVGELRTLLF
ncbi:MAG TPA: hypothetical protein VGM27_30765 [Acidobacteriaceae bacterium]